MSRITGEEFLQSKDIWNHPNLTDRNNKECYDVAELLDEYVAECQKDEEWGRAFCKRKPLPDGSLPLTESELAEFRSFYNLREKIILDAKYIDRSIRVGFKYPDSEYVEDLKTSNVKAILYLANLFDLTGEK